MARPANDEPTRRWTIPLPESLAGAIEHELMDEGTKKPEYGKRGKLIQTLLEQWLADRRAAPNLPSEPEVEPQNG